MVVHALGVIYARWEPQWLGHRRYTAPDVFHFQALRLVQKPSYREYNRVVRPSTTSSQSFIGPIAALSS